MQGSNPPGRPARRRKPARPTKTKCRGENLRMSAGGTLPGEASPRFSLDRARFRRLRLLCRRDCLRDSTDTDSTSQPAERARRRQKGCAPWGLQYIIIVGRRTAPTGTCGARLASPKIFPVWAGHNNGSLNPCEVRRQYSTVLASGVLDAVPTAAECNAAQRSKVQCADRRHTRTGRVHVASLKAYCVHLCADAAAQNAQKLLRTRREAASTRLRYLNSDPRVDRRSQLSPSVFFCSASCCAYR